jgi:hypothetical protein
MKSTKNVLLATSIAALLAAPLAAHAGVADPFLFNPFGTGLTKDAQTITTIDQAPGNALAKNANQTITQNPDGTTSYNTGMGQAFTLYYQANIQAFTNGKPVFASGLGGVPFFTTTAGFGEVVTSYSQSDTKRSLGFSYDSTNPVNFLRIYANTSGTDLTGSGFSGGNVIYEGTVINETASSFDINTAATDLPVVLDQFGTDNYGGVKSLTGSGSSTITVQTTKFDAGYFPDLTVGALILSTFTTSNATPFTSVDPSACFASKTTDCAIQYNIGPVNVIGGPDVLLQADASQTLALPAAIRPVPEPATTAMLGLGLALVGVFAGRGKKKQQA